MTVQTIGDSDMKSSAACSNDVVDNAGPSQGGYLPGASITECFEGVCARHPDRIAVTCNSENIAYHSLNIMADDIAAQLLALDVAKGSFVAVWLERSIPLVAAMLGVLKAGCVYVPLDAGYPTARIAETLEDAKPVALITTRDLSRLLPDVTTPLLLLDDKREKATGRASSVPTSNTTRADIAYLMYTSGSTGKPKGVLVTHENVLRLFEQTQHIYQFDQNDVWTMFHSFAFDFSVWEIYGALLYGGRVVIVPFEVSRTPEAFYSLLSAEKVTVLNQTPSAFRLLLEVENTGKVHPLALRYVILGGEALSAPTLSVWFERHGEIIPRVFNMYGITETTVHVTCHQVTIADTKFAETPMGKPLGDLTIYLLDEEGKQVTTGQIGELYVSGSGVARGYHNRPVLTEERFLGDPFRGDGTMMYRSGDMACRREDGALVYAGRRDDQVKIHGFRVEMAEIDAAMAAFPGVRHACVIPIGEGQEKKLVAYFVSQPGANITVASLSAFLSERLPPQMLPSRLIAVDKIPLTPNGKVDRKALLFMNPAMPDVLHHELSPKSELSELEVSVLALVRDTIGSQEIPINGNLFEYGVESLQITRFAVRARERFGVKLALRDLFEAETIADIARRIEEMTLQNKAMAGKEA